MSDSSSPTAPAAAPTAAQQGEALFANLVAQQVNMAMLFLGKLPAEDGAQPRVDLDLAGVCIETLEMLAAKTRGNLTAPEQELLQRNLTAVRMWFVEQVDQAEAAPAPPKPPAAEIRPTPATAPTADAPAEKPTGQAEDGPRRFVKKY